MQNDLSSLAFQNLVSPGLKLECWSIHLSFISPSDKTSPLIIQKFYESLIHLDYFTIFIYINSGISKINYHLFDGNIIHNKFA